MSSALASEGHQVIMSCRNPHLCEYLLSKDDCRSDKSYTPVPVLNALSLSQDPFLKADREEYLSNLLLNDFRYQASLIFEFVASMCRQSSSR